MPKVSVITPVYNRPEYLEEAVLSIQRQTYTDWEHIIVDDGSSNPITTQILSKISNYPNIRVFRTENKGLGAARNYGISKAQGEYLLTLDDDDRFKPGFLSLAVDVLDREPTVGIVGCWVEEFGYKTGKKKLYGSDVKSFLVNSNAPACSLFRKACWEAVGGYDETKYFMGYADWDIWLKITTLGWRCHMIQQYLLDYRLHKHGAMHNADEEIKNELLARLIENNLAAYRDNMVYYIQQKNYQLDEALKSVKQSADFKIGSFLLSPIRWLVNLFN